MRRRLLLDRTVLCLAAALLILDATCACFAHQSSLEAEMAPGLASITTNALLGHIKILASDEYEGRAPGTVGEALSVNYLVGQFQHLGLKPGNPDGGYVQKVPLMGSKAKPSISFAMHGGTITPGFPTECVIWSKRFQPEVKVENSDLVFVGYGVVAPEYGWDDYKDVDVKGKTIVMLVNDPQVPDPKDPSKLDDSMFKGRAMTYYGRWTYKYEIAAAKGAAAAIIIHETGPAGYPWMVIEGSSSTEQFDLQAADSNRTRVAIEGWITTDIARKLLASGGQDFDKLKAAAIRKDFRPVALDGKASFSVQNTLRTIASRNVIAKVEGSDPKLKDQYVIYTAHWDHLGKDPRLQGDQIYNGAVDNGSGCSALLELAKAFTKVKPKRSILFLSVTAEEKGLLGSKYYATHPLYPLKNTLADINMDSMNVWGRSHDISLVGSGQSSLEELLAAAAAAEGRVVSPDPSPEKGYYFRSDHFEFAKQGVPGLDTHSGSEFIGKPADFGKQTLEYYTEHDYHKVSDEIKPNWDLAGMVDDVGLMFRVGYAIAQGDQWPQWKTGSEFKARRDEMLK